MRDPKVRGNMPAQISNFIGRAPTSVEALAADALARHSDLRSDSAGPASEETGSRVAASGPAQESWPEQAAALRRRPARLVIAGTR